MAGPGGGPPRRSHTKSRKGCETCKRRHIRCDENFPQCRNCTKHKIRCPYNDLPMSEDRAITPDKADLMWTPEIEAAVDQWQRTGVFPFPSLNIFPAPASQRFSREELRLIYHVAAICHQLSAIDANGFTLWTRYIPTILRLGATHHFVMHALLGFSASHMAFLTECPHVANMAENHRNMALTGLAEAIGSFSRETSDAVLGASLVLSWQATDWKSWTQHMQGTYSVIEAMDQWKHESQFGEFIAESTTFPTAPPSPSPDHRTRQPLPEDLDAYSRTLRQLQKVETHLRHIKEDPKPISQLITFMKGARKVTSTNGVGQQFERLRPLRTWLFWLPVMFLQKAGGSPTALLTIAHYYTVAMLMERLFPEIGAAYFGSLALGPVEDIARRLLSIAVNGGGVEDGAQAALSLLDFPITTIDDFRARMGWVQPNRTQSFPQFSPPNFYVGENVPSPPPPMPTEGYLPYGSPAFSYSTESFDGLPPVTTASGLTAPGEVTTAAVSPLTLSSPFPNHQYLSVPSPSYAAAYSPASSTFGEGSIAYSDHEDFIGSYSEALRGGLADATPTLGGYDCATSSASMDNFGVGFVTPIQTVWI